MSVKNYYANIAVVEVHSDSIVTIESISVTRGECVLSGAWEFSINNKEEIVNIVSGRLIIPIGNATKVREIIGNQAIKYIEAKTFLTEAKKSAIEAMEAYELFQAKDLNKRKKLVEPTFFSWPSELDFNKSSEYLESIGKMAVPAFTPERMKKTLAAARLVKFFVDMWQRDEQERGNRKYVEGADAEITILPVSWLKEFQLIE